MTKSVFDMGDAVKELNPQPVGKLDKALLSLKTNVALLRINFQHLRNTGQSVTKSIANGFVTALKSIGKTGVDKTISGFENLKSKISQVKAKLTDGEKGVKGFANAFKNIGKSGLDGLTNTIKKIGNMGKSGFTSAANGAKSLGSNLKKAAAVSFDKIKSGLSKLKSDTQSATSGFDKFKTAAKNAASKIKSAFSGVSGTIKAVAGNLTSASDTITAKIFNLKNLVAGVATGAVVQKSIDIVVDRQNITSQFEVLLGSAEKAQERVNELTDFAGMTPFTRDEIFAASKQLQVFAGDALSTGDSLRVIGDVAAGTGQPFEDVALWVGRLYDSLKSGKPVGEMTSRLQEMGAISGEGRDKIEKLVSSGMDMADKWSVVEGIFSRYDGTMEKLSNNLGNMLTSLKSFATNSIFLPLGEGITKGLQPAIEKFREFRNTNKADVEAMGEVIRSFAEKICVPLFSKIEQGVEFVIKAVGSLKNGMSGLNNLKGKFPLLDKVIDGFNFVFAHKEAFIEAFKRITVVIGGVTAAGKFTKIISALSGLLNPITLVTAAFGGLFALLKNDSENGGTALTDLKNVAVTVFDNIKGAISTFVDIISDNKAAFTNIINGIIELLPPLAEAFGELLTAALELAKNALPILMDVFKSLFGAVKPLLKKLPDFIGFLADIIKWCGKTKTIEKLVAIFVGYKTAVFASNAVTAICNGLLKILSTRANRAAIKTKLLNAAMDANPITMVVSALGFLIGGLTTYSAIAGDSSDDTSKFKANLDNMTTSVQNMRDAFDNVKVTLPDFDRLRSLNGYTSSNIDEKITKKEEAITAALDLAAQNQQKIRNEDIQNIRGYMQELEGLETEKLSIYMKQQMGQITAFEATLKQFPGDLNKQSEALKGGNEAYEQTVEYIYQVDSRRKADARNLYDAEYKELSSKYSGTALTEASKAIQQEYENELRTINTDTNGYLKEASNSLVLLYSKAADSQGKAASESIDNLKEDMDINIDRLKCLGDAFSSNVDIGREASGIKQTSEVEKMGEAFNELRKNYFDIFDNDSMQHIQNLFTTLAEAKKNGAELSVEVKKQAEGFLSKFEEFYNNPYLGEKAREKGKEMFAYFTKGMVDGKGNAIDTADMSLKEMINAARNTLDMNAPEVEQKAKGMFSGIFDFIKNNINNVNDSTENINLSGVGQSVGTTEKKVCSSLTKMNNSTSRSFQNIRRNGEMNTACMSNSVVNNVNRMKSNVEGINLFSTGVNVMNGLINGMMSKLSAVSIAASETCK